MLVTLTVVDSQTDCTFALGLKSWPPPVTGLISDILGNSAVGET